MSFVGLPQWRGWWPQVPPAMVTRRILAPCAALPSLAASSSLMRRLGADHGHGSLDVSTGLKLAIPLRVHGQCIHGRLTVDVLKCVSECGQ
jgi:hypothetical protein